DQEELLATVGSSFNMSNKVNLQVPITKKVNFDIFAEYTLGNEVSEEDILNRLNSDKFESRNDVANNKGLRNLSFYAGTQWNIRTIKNLRITVGLRWLNLENQYNYFGKLENTSSKHNYLLPNVNISYKGIS